MDSIQPAPSPGGSGPVSPVGRSPGGTLMKSRKRTKTGCLTCRKRRIKCGEERPTCANCIKSKRQCEGYNQRVIFKAPMGEWPNHPGVVSTMQYHNSLLPGARPYRSGQTSPQSPDLPRGAVQARQFDFSNVETGPTPTLKLLNTQQTSMGGPQAYLKDSQYQQPLHSPHHHPPLHSPHLVTPTSGSSYFPSQPSPAHSNFRPSYAHNGSVGYETQQRYPQAGQYQQVAYDTQINRSPPESQPPPEQTMYQHQTSEDPKYYLVEPQGQSRAEGYPQYSEQRPSIPRYGSSTAHHPSLTHVDYSQGGQYPSFSAPSQAHPTHSSFQSSVQIPQHDVNPDVKFMPQHAPTLEQTTAVSNAQEQSQSQLLLSGFGGIDHVSPTQILDEAAIECEDDDYYDVQSDEEMLDVQDSKNEEAAVLSRDFSLIQRINRKTTTELDIRRYDAFIYEGILSHYQAEQVANPLKNPKTARVFMHFIHVTGPTLSIFERNPRNPSPLYEGHAPPSPSHQSLWTYTLPLKALNHQGLLHAMLALGSLHIAKLQRASVTPSWKHYAYAMKRLRRSLGNPKKRHQLSTLGTSLLLGFYEVMTAEHAKWSTHLVGAAQLLVEIDFRSLTREACRLKAAELAEQERFPQENPDMLIDQKQFEQRMKDSSMMPDENLVSTIVGKRVSFDGSGCVFEEEREQGKKPCGPQKMDLRSYETLQDLYWWYAKQDLFQSIVSGNPLIMDYAKWSDCPPRAPIGRTDALVGSLDHIILLIGRIADFIVRDRERKIKQMEADGQGRRIPGMPKMGGVGPSSRRGPGRHSQPCASSAQAGPSPSMHGDSPSTLCSGPHPPAQDGAPPPGWKGLHETPSSSSRPGPPRHPSFMPPRQKQDRCRPPQPLWGPPPPAAQSFYGMVPSHSPISLPASYANLSRQPGRPTSPPLVKHHAPDLNFSDLPSAYESALQEWQSISTAHDTVAQILSNTPSFAPLPPDLGPPVPSPAGTNLDPSTSPFGPPILHRSYDISIIWSLLHLSSILLLRSHPSMPPAAMTAASLSATATAPYAILIGRIAAGLHIPSENLTPALGAALIESTISLFFAGVQYKEKEQREWLIERLLSIDRRTGWASAGIIARSCETSWEKAREMGEGPSYVRVTRRFGDGPVRGRDAPSVDGEDEDGGGLWGGRGAKRFVGAGGTREMEIGAKMGMDESRMDMENHYTDPKASGSKKRVRETDSEHGGIQYGHADDTGRERPHSEWDPSEKRYVVRHRAGFVPWAMNVLATEEDLRVRMESVELEAGGDGDGDRVRNGI